MGIITSETKKAHVIKFDFGKQNIYELRISVKSNRFMGACEEEGTAEIVGVASFGLGVFEELESSSSSSDRFLFPADFLSFEWEEESEVAEREDSDPASAFVPSISSSTEPLGVSPSVSTEAWDTLPSSGNGGRQVRKTWSCIQQHFSSDKEEK
jgi:hypothetical protein